MMPNNSALQSKSPSLAGLPNISQLQGCTPCRQYPKHFGDSHSAKESAQCGGSEHRLNIRPMFEFYIAGIPASKQYQNRDLYVGAGGDVLKSQDIKKRSTYSCIGQKVGKKKDSISNATLSTTANGYQPFGSIPRDCNSLRRTRLIHVARDESPSLRISSSSCDRKSSESRIGNCLERFSGIDMVYTSGSIIMVYTSVYANDYKEQCPEARQTLTGHLTTTVIYSNEEAMQENTTPAQGRHSLNLKTGNEQ